MYCPSCGSEERQPGQFCRACGVDLRPVRVAIEKPDAITHSAVAARNEIGRALADRIRELESAEDLSTVAEDVLPEIEKFLESPEEKRLRRIRFGVALAALGFGAALGFSVLSVIFYEAARGAGNQGDLNLYLLMTGLGFTALLFGLGIALNGMYFTLPRQTLPDHSSERLAQHAAEAKVEAAPKRLTAAEAESFVAAVTEHTTRELAAHPARQTNRT